MVGLGVVGPYGCYGRGWCKMMINVVCLDKLFMVKESRFAALTKVVEKTCSVYILAY